MPVLSPCSVPGPFVGVFVCMCHGFVCLTVCCNTCGAHKSNMCVCVCVFFLCGGERGRSLRGSVALRHVGSKGHWKGRGGSNPHPYMNLKPVRDKRRER